MIVKCVDELYKNGKKTLGNINNINVHIHTEFTNEIIRNDNSSFCKEKNLLKYWDVKKKKSPRGKRHATGLVN